jgi:hypothetical protein
VGRVFNLNGGKLTEPRFDLIKTFGSDTILNYHLSKKFKLIRKCKFNHLIITLMYTSLTCGLKLLFNRWPNMLNI